MNSSTTFLNLDFVLLGTSLGLNHITLPFFLLSAFIWFVVFLYGHFYHSDDPNKFKMLAFLGATCFFNLLMVLSEDLVTFYASFTLMNFIATGLIIHQQGKEALKASQVYISLVIIGELLVLPALWFLVTESQSYLISDLREVFTSHEHKQLIGLLLFGGFAIKAGVFPLHVWLPLAHPVAPTPASSVLSGLLVKAAPLAWLQLFDFSSISLPSLGYFIIALGLFTAFYGALVGCFQIATKAALAYSTVSQMGVVTALVGSLLVFPDTVELLVPAILIYILHHGIVKTLLFLGDDLKDKVHGYWVKLYHLIYGLLLLSLSGLFLTTGFFAKEIAKSSLYVSEINGVDVFIMAFSLTSITTSALVFSIFRINMQGLHISSQYPERKWVWFSMIIIGPLLFISLLSAIDSSNIEFHFANVMMSFVMIILGALIAYVFSLWRLVLPQGDIVILYLFIVNKILSLKSKLQIQIERDYDFDLQEMLKNMTYYSGSSYSKAFSLFGLIIFSVLIYIISS